MVIEDGKLVWWHDINIQVICVALEVPQRFIWNCYQPSNAVIFIILHGTSHSRPVPVQNFWTYESIWTCGRIPWKGDQPDARHLPTQGNTEKRGHTSMPQAGFKHAIPVFERSKTVHALDHAATGTGSNAVSQWQFFQRFFLQFRIPFLSDCKFVTVLWTFQC